MSTKFPSVFTALVTPFLNDKVEFRALERILQAQIDGGIKGVIVAGSTGEGLSLSLSEHKSLLRFALDFSKGSMLVLSSCSGFTTRETLQLVEMSVCEGAGGIMCGIPPYLKPSQRGVLEHFKAIGRLSNLPTLLYSVPQRTGSDFSDEALAELSTYSNVVAIKDASSSSLDRVLRLSGNLPLGFFCGADKEILSFTVNGGVGCVSVASNLLPSHIVRLQNMALEGRNKEALALHRSLLELYGGLSLEGNPTAVKYCMSLIGLCSNEVRLPLFELSGSSKKVLEGLAKELWQK